MKQQKTEATRGKPWTPDEQAAAIAAYNAMLRATSAGLKFSKAGAIRWLRGDMPRGIDRASIRKHTDACNAASILGMNHAPSARMLGALAARSRGSVEAKLMNISAARAQLGLPILPGYKPAGNFQRSLLEAVQLAEQAAA
jgi:hypothetical protein